MKEFKQWDKNNKINYASISGKELNVQEERRKSWRAALKRVLKECKYNGDGEYIAFISLWIKEELEDERV